MYTVSQLVDILNLQTENQVRNRLNALRDSLVGHLRRGPNNQLLLTESGLELLRSLQALCETGHTLKEAASLIRYEDDTKDIGFHGHAPQTGTYGTTQGTALSPDAPAWQLLVQHLAEQLRTLEARVAALEAKLQGHSGQAPWWDKWR